MEEIQLIEAVERYIRFHFTADVAFNSVEDRYIVVFIAHGVPFL